MIIDYIFYWNFSALRLLICSWILNLFHCILDFFFRPYKVGTTPWTTKLSNAENQQYSCIKFTFYIIYHCKIVYVAQNLASHLISKNHSKHLFLKHHFILPSPLFALCILDVSRHYKYILFIACSLYLFLNLVPLLNTILLAHATYFCSALSWTVIYQKSQYKN